MCIVHLDNEYTNAYHIEVYVCKKDLVDNQTPSITRHK